MELLQSLSTEKTAILFGCAVGGLAILAGVATAWINAWKQVRRKEEQSRLIATLLDRGLSPQEVERLVRATDTPSNVSEAIAGIFKQPDANPR